ncbi:MAG: CPBP family intramembrane glutamic endopeptidase [Candidatus Odinarchaeota archaeon]
MVDSLEFCLHILSRRPLQEEFGWRGYALPRFQAKYSALISSVVLGIIWAVWHFPLNFMYWLGPPYELGLSMFLSTVILFIFVSILFTWIYNNTGGSILAALIFHTMLNLSTYVVFPVFETQTGPTFYFTFIIIASIIIIAVFGFKTMMRKGKVSTNIKISDAT